MKKRETVTLDRDALFLALASLRSALLRNDTTAALRALDSIYRLLPIAQPQPTTSGR